MYASFCITPPSTSAHNQRFLSGIHSHIYNKMVLYNYANPSDGITTIPANAQWCEENLHQNIHGYDTCNAQHENAYRVQRMHTLEPSRPIIHHVKKEYSSIPYCRDYCNEHSRDRSDNDQNERRQNDNRGCYTSRTRDRGCSSSQSRRFSTGSRNSRQLRRSNSCHSARSNASSLTRPEKNKTDRPNWSRAKPDDIC